MHVQTHRAHVTQVVRNPRSLAKTSRVSSFPRVRVGIPRRFQQGGPRLRARTADTTGGMMELWPWADAGECLDMR